MMSMVYDLDCVLSLFVLSSNHLDLTEETRLHHKKKRGSRVNSLGDFSDFLEIASFWSNFIATSHLSHFPFHGGEKCLGTGTP